MRQTDTETERQTNRQITKLFVLLIAGNKSCGFSNRLWLLCETFAYSWAQELLIFKFIYLSLISLLFCRWGGRGGGGSSGRLTKVISILRRPVNFFSYFFFFILFFFASFWNGLEIERPGWSSPTTGSLQGAAAAAVALFFCWFFLNLPLKFKHTKMKACQNPEQGLTFISNKTICVYL